MKITFKKIILIVLVCLFALLVLGGYFLLWPKYQEFKKKKTEMETKNEEIRLKEEYLSSLEDFSEKLLTYDEQLSKIDSAFPVNSSPADVLSFLQKTSLENGLILTDVDINKPSSLKDPTQQGSKGKIQEMSLSVSVSGSYSAFKNFLSAIYRSSRLIEVELINFSSDEGKNLFDFSLELKTQFYGY